MATTLMSYLVSKAFGSIPRPSSVAGRVDLFQSTLRQARSLGIELPSATKALQTFRKVGYGISRDTFSSMYKSVSSISPSVAKQQLIKWTDRIPMEIIPHSESKLSTKYLYTYKVNVQDNITGEWKERYVSIGSDRKLTVKQAWNTFNERFVDTGLTGAENLYGQTMDNESVVFEGVERK